MKLFPPFRLDTANQCLWRSTEAGADERILLTPKSFEVLRYLVEHAGRLITQRELLDAVWPDTFIEPRAGPDGEHSRRPSFTSVAFRPLDVAIEA